MALWNRLCTKCKALLDELRAVDPIPVSNMTSKTEDRDLPLPPHTAARSDSEYSYAIAENSYSSDTTYARDTSSCTLEWPPSMSSNWSEENDRGYARNESIDVEELSISFSSCSLPDYIPLNDSSFGTSSDESDFSWSDFTWSDCEEHDMYGKCVRGVPSFLRSLQYNAMTEEEEVEEEEKKEKRSL